jgi:hypothetical protein
MPAIFTTEGTTINTEHVIQFTKLRNGETRFLLSSGNQVTATVSGDIDERFYPIVPANPGHAGVFVDYHDGQFNYRISSVIAWRICPGGNFPIFAEEGELLDACDAMIDPLGGVCDDEGNTCLALAEWKKTYEDRVRVVDQKDAE